MVCGDKVCRALPTARTDDPTHVKDFIDWRCSLRYDDFADIDIGNSFARRDFPAVENRRIDRGIKVRLQSSNLCRKLAIVGCLESSHGLLHQRRKLAFAGAAQRA